MWSEIALTPDALGHLTRPKTDSASNEKEARLRPVIKFCIDSVVELHAAVKPAAAGDCASR